MRLFLVFVALFAVAVTVFELGPQFEGAVAPVLDVRAVGVKNTGANLEFALDGHKYRACRLENYSVGWRVDHSIITVALQDEIGTPVGIFDGIQAGEDYTLGPFWAPIPDAARTYKQATLKITYYYRCSFLWLTEQATAIPLKG